MKIKIPARTLLGAACTLALAVLSTTASAQLRDPDEKALLHDARGAVVTSGTGLCWHTNFGPPPDWTGGCHAAVPVVMTPVAQYIAPAPARAAAPVAVAVVPVKQEPVRLALVAPQPVFETVAFDANVLFDTNRSELRPASRDTLDAFINRIRGLDTQSIMAVGYADRMGSDGSNQVLSQNRVNAVKAYLVGKGISAERIQSSAFGESRPTTAFADCKEANNATNVACLQPDRHVFIQISGSRIAK